MRVTSPRLNTRSVSVCGVPAQVVSARSLQGCQRHAQGKTPNFEVLWAPVVPLDSVGLFRGTSKTKSLFLKIYTARNRNFYFLRLELTRPSAVLAMIGHSLLGRETYGIQLQVFSFGI